MFISKTNYLFRLNKLQFIDWIYKAHLQKKNNFGDYTVLVNLNVVILIQFDLKKGCNRF